MKPSGWFTKRKDLVTGPATILLVIILCLIFSSPIHAQKDKKWWEKWDPYPKDPKVPRITAKQVKNLMLAGEKIVFVYAGYKVNEVVCGSFYVPYTLVPPGADGSGVRIKIPKNYWIMCY
jgi:hypothetical protein